MNLLSLIGDRRVAKILGAFSGVKTGGGLDYGPALDLAVRVAPTVAIMLDKSVDSVDAAYIVSLADAVGVDLSGAAGPIAQLLRDEGEGFKGSLIQFFSSPQGKSFLSRFVKGGRMPEPTQCPACGHITF
jgi:hypothetical protein